MDMISIPGRLVKSMPVIINGKQEKVLEVPESRNDWYFSTEEGSASR